MKNDTLEIGSRFDVGIIVTARKQRGEGRTEQPSGSGD